MPYSFRHLNLRYKLICFFILPLIIIVFVSIFHVHKQINDYQYASRDLLSIEVAKQAVFLIHSLQQERTLSAAAIDSKLFDHQQLNQAKQNTDVNAKNFYNSTALTKLVNQLESKQNDKINLKKYVNKLKIFSHELSSVRQQLSKNHYSSSFLFYSNYIDDIFSTIHQLQIQNRNIDESLDYNEFMHFLLIAEVVSKEQVYIAKILRNVTVDLHQYNEIINTFNKQVNELNQAKNLLTDRHNLLLTQFLDSEKNHLYFHIMDQITHQLKLNSDAKRIRYHLGYVFLLKHYQKNAEENLKHHINKIIVLIKLINHNQYKTPEQKQAFKCVQDHLKLLNIHSLLPNKQTSPKINSSDTNKEFDIELSQCLDVIQTQATPININQWNDISNARLTQLHDLVQKIITSITLLSHQQQQYALHVIGFYLGGTFLLLLISYIFGYFIIHGFTKNISLIARDMKLMTRNPNLKLRVQIEGHDEIAQIAQSLNEMLEEKQKSQKLLDQAYVVFNSSSEGIIITNAENQIELVNPAFTTITGYSLEDVAGKKPSMLSSNKHPFYFFSIMWKELLNTGSWCGEIYNKNKQGEIYPVHLTTKLVTNSDGQIKHHIGLYSDLSQKKEYEKKLWKQANIDKLTELPNRQFFRSRLRQDLLIAQHQNTTLGMILIDLDGFKYINDSLSHSVGDSLLQQVSHRLTSILNKDYFIARFGGDEFVILIPKLENHQVLEQQAKQIQLSFNQEFKLKNKNIAITSSIGVAIYPYHGCDADSLSRNAEAAMFKAKDKGRNNITYYDVSLNQSLIKRANLEQLLRRALLQQEFSIFYQPIVDLKMGKVTAAEALIRWKNPELGFVSPIEFIPLAEETGLINPIGHWIVNQVFTDLKALNANDIDINISINVSSRQFSATGEENFVAFLASSMTKHQIDPCKIHIEITESLLIENNQLNLDRLNTIRNLGCNIYLDDFGTGFSSLSYLKKFPISVIKIDKSFMDNLFHTLSDTNLVKAIINMGRSLEMPLVAEGVETKEQLDFLQEQQCDFIQGYLFSRPLPLVQLIEFIKNF